MQMKEYPESPIQYFFLQFFIKILYSKMDFC